MCVDLERVGRRVKSLRADRGWTQADLAAESETSVSSIAKVEQGRQCMTIDTLCQIADAFGVGVEVVLCRDAA